MAKLKGKGVVVAGLLAGAASFLRKKENRDKAMEYLNQAKQKVNDSGGVQGLMDKVTSTTQKTPEGPAGAVAAKGHEDVAVEETFQDVASTAGNTANSVLEGNHIIDEGGGQTTLAAFNEQQDKSN